MKTCYYLLVIVVLFFSACGPNKASMNNSTDMYIPILQVKDSTFMSLLSSLTIYKDSCQFYDKSRTDNFFWFSPRIDENQDTLIEIETEKDVNIYLSLSEDITLQGIIQMGECYFLFFDTLGILDKYFDVTNRMVKMVYFEDDMIYLREFDTWFFLLANNHIYLQEFYPYD